MTIEALFVFIVIFLLGYHIGKRHASLKIGVLFKSVQHAPSVRKLENNEFPK